MRKDKKNRQEDELSAPAWMVTYGDMMTLILCFFVLLFSFSSIDAAKFEKVMEAFKARLGILVGGRTFDETQVLNRGLDSQLFTKNYYDISEFKVLVSELEEFIEESDLESEVSLEEQQRGLVIRMKGKVLFDLGKADLKPAGIKTLKSIATFLEDIPNELNIEGHTDNLPINNDDFPNNWVLSTVRATNVIIFLEKNTKIKSARLSASGYGPYRPIVPNDSSENRTMNRRVEIVVQRTLMSPEEIKREG